MAILFNSGRFKATDIDNAPIPGAFLAFYATGTSTPQPIYSDPALQIPLTNPIQSDGNGLMPEIWLDDSLPAYKVVFSQPDANNNAIPGAVIWTIGQYTALGGKQLFALINPLTAAETAAGITPTNFAYLPGNAMRYANAVGDGLADDTPAVAAAVLVASQTGGPRVLIPSGFIFKITSYIQLLSNVVLDIQGAVQLTNRASGLFVNGGSNISIYGHNKGLFTDSVVAANYVWNNSNLFNVPEAPAIHIRSGTNVVVDGVLFKYVSAGVLISNADTTIAPTGENWTFAQGLASPTNCVVRGCNTQLCEQGGITAINGFYIDIDDNYVYRCGDGGLWFMRCFDSRIINNRRISPKTVPADVVTFGRNSLAHPTTWNDEQGIQLEACARVTVQGNHVYNFWAQGIDVKNGCNIILVTGNTVAFCENASIITRQGDAVLNACNKITISNNTVSEHGTLQYNSATSYVAAIVTAETHICDIMGNVIYSYQGGNAISAKGPGSYLLSQFPTVPFQSSVRITDNCIDFKNVSFENSSESIGFTATTPTAVVVSGFYSSVEVSRNKFFADIYFNGDPRINGAAQAISVSYLTTSNINYAALYYPTNCKIDNNQIADWGQAGIGVAGLTAMVSSGLSVSGNNIGRLGATSAIALTRTNQAVVCNNVINQFIAGGAPAISIAGASGQLVTNCVVCNNSIAGVWDTGTNVMTYGIGLTFCTNMSVNHNRIVLGASGNISVTSCTGDINCLGSTGFPRSGAGTPNAMVTSLWFGEMYWDSSGSHWFAASGAQSTAWTQLSN